jgi:ABC-type antimicrobial peptide transport system permease subunit
MARSLADDEELGKDITLSGMTQPIVGVVKDFETNTLYDPIEPVIIRLAPQNTTILYVRLVPGMTTEGLAALEAVYKQFNPAYPFDYGFLDENFEDTYQSEIIIGSLANLFAIIAIFISCLGLLGLVSFSVERRTKEIGVRKVLGASVPHLVMLLTGETTKLVLLGIALAIPVSYFVVQSWLAPFQHHIEVGIGLYLAAGLSAVLISWLAVGYQSLKAALADPVRSLRYE